MKCCESCGIPPSGIEHGPFAGMLGTHDYCAYCSKDLCENCFDDPCEESPTGKHEKDEEAEDE